MSGPKHTPEPWKACKDGECRCGMVFGGGGNTLVATATWPDDESGHGPKAQEEQRANAKLIAAAPRLAEALKEMEAAYRDLQGTVREVPERSWDRDRWNAAEDRLHAAADDARAALREAGVTE